MGSPMQNMHNTHITHACMSTHKIHNMHTQHACMKITDLGTKLGALCTSGAEAAVRELLKDSDTNVNEADSKGETLLHKACHASKLQIVTLLLQQDGIDISRKNNNEQTPLHIASKMGNVEAAQLLLDAESNESNAMSCVNSPDNQGLTPLCYSTKIQMVNLLRERCVAVRYILYSVFLFLFAGENFHNLFIC